MKKSEKIEVRVSFEEKQRLSGIAETRGLSVSELIRDAVAEEIGTVPHVPRWPGYAAIAAGVLAAAALVAAVLPGTARGPALAAQPSVMSVSLSDRDFGGSTNNVIALRDGAQQSYQLDLQNGRVIRVDAKLDAVSTEVMGVDVTACLETPTDCIHQRTRRLTIQRNPHKGSSGYAKGNIKLDETVLEVVLSVRPTPTAEPAES